MQFNTTLSGCGARQLPAATKRLGICRPLPRAPFRYPPPAALGSLSLEAASFGYSPRQEKYPAGGSHLTYLPKVSPLISHKFLLYASKGRWIEGQTLHNLSLGFGRRIQQSAVVIMIRRMDQLYLVQFQQYLLECEFAFAHILA